MPHGERLNSATHGAGLILAIAGTVVLVLQALQPPDATKALAAAAFGLSMVALYACSTLYHGLSGPRKALWARLDHCSIYVLITGTYAPFSLIAVGGAWGWALLAAVGALALLGIARELASHRDRAPSVTVYLALGWAGLLLAFALAERLRALGLGWLLGGCLLYSIGIVFYANDRRWRHAHGVWHLFVLAGSASHFLAVRQMLN